MDILFDVNWSELFVPTVPVGETILRGSLTYLFLFGLLRLVLKRQAGAVSISDLLVVVLIADAAQNAMASDYSSITDGVILVATIVAWSYGLDWLGYRFPHLQHLVHPSPLPLIKEGRMLRHNMYRELITEGELMSQLRKQGVEDLDEVEAAYMEGDGHISVIPYNSSGHQGSEEEIR